MSDSRSLFRSRDDGLLLRVRVTPRASRKLVVGPIDTPDGEALQIKVQEVPEGGAANAAVERLLADWLEVPKSDVTLLSGQKSRVKMMHVRGASGTLVQVLQAKLTEPEAGR